MKSSTRVLLSIGSFFLLSWTFTTSAEELNQSRTPTSYQQLIESIDKIDMRKIYDLMEKIRHEYIEEVTVETLAEGCLKEIHPQQTNHADFISEQLKHIQDEQLLNYTSKVDILKKFPFAVAIYISSKVSSKSDATPLFTKCAIGITDSLNKESFFITKENYKKNNLSAAGIGVMVQLKEGFNKNTVISTAESGPAMMAGIKLGDKIISINGTLLESLSEEEVMDQIKGEVDSIATLVVQRHALKEPLTFRIQRKTIMANDFFKSKLLRPNFGYIGMIELGHQTSKHFIQALHRLYFENDGKLRGLIIDLRNNSGGLLNETVGVSTPFLPPRSLIAELKGRSAETSMKLTTASEDSIGNSEISYKELYSPEYQDLPLVILINHETASGAEIIASAMKDHKRATIIGQPSFGKNTVRTTFPMSTGEALTMTTSVWYTPTNRLIRENIGITPDILTEETKISDIGTENDNTINKALEFLQLSRN